MTENISRDDAMYFLIFAVAAADQIEGGVFFGYRNRIR